MKKTIKPPIIKKPTPQKPGGKVQPEKHTIVKTDRGDFKFREPMPQNWK